MPEVAKAIASKIAEKTHCSSKRALTDFYLIKNLVEDEDVVNQLELSDEELEWIKVKI